MAITAKDVQSLRQAAGVGMMDAKKALTETDGDIDAAITLLRERGLAKAAKRADRDASEGVIGSYLHEQGGRVVTGVLVRLASETDFVAKSPEFVDTARDIAMHVAWAKPRWVSREDVDQAELDAEKDVIAKQAQNEGKPEHIIPQIVEGRIAKFYQDHVLLEQTFVNAEKFEGTIEEYVQALAIKMGENISISGFSRLAIGQE
ncbi:MAG: elongation factor Ts [Acidimicrobiia bacterium]|jgi:elongation factor Ts|nr:MAG: elongation factor Ts [Acidimicrobiia bacterium]